MPQQYVVFLTLHALYLSLSLLLQMAEAALQKKIEKAETAVAKANGAVARAQAAHDAELGHNKALWLEMLVAEKNVLVARSTPWHS